MNFLDSIIFLNVLVPFISVIIGSTVSFVISLYFSRKNSRELIKEKIINTISEIIVLKEKINKGMAENFNRLVIDKYFLVLQIRVDQLNLKKTNNNLVNKHIETLEKDHEIDKNELDKLIKLILES